MLFLVADLKNVEFQVVGIFGVPQNGVIRRLRAVFHLPQPLVDIPGGLTDGLGEQLVVHKMGTGAGGEEAAVPDELHCPEVDLPIARHRLFHGGAGLGEGRRIENHKVKFQSKT